MCFNRLVVDWWGFPLLAENNPPFMRGFYIRKKEPCFSLLKYLPCSCPVGKWRWMREPFMKHDQIMVIMIWCPWHWRHCYTQPRPIAWNNHKISTPLKINMEHTNPGCIVIVIHDGYGRIGIRHPDLTPNLEEWVESVWKWESSWRGMKNPTILMTIPHHLWIFVEFVFSGKRSASLKRIVDVPNYRKTKHVNKLTTKLTKQEMFQSW